MSYDEISFISYLSGGLIFSILTIIFAYFSLKNVSYLSLTFACGVTAGGLLFIAANYQGVPLTKAKLTIIETLRYGVWIIALISTLKFSSNSRLTTLFKLGFHGPWLLSLTAALVLVITNNENLLNHTDYFVWNSLGLSILCLIAIEQFYRNSAKQRLFKLLSIAIAAFIFFDIYLFSYSLIAKKIDPDLWQARGAINALAALFMIIACLLSWKTLPVTKNLTLSRPLVFYSTSLTAAGAFLSLVAIGGYYIQLYGGSWATILQLLLIFSSAYLLISVASSATIRARLAVWINKNLFHHKYDYRREWLRLIQYLSQPVEDDGLYEHALGAVTTIFHSPGGCIFMEQQGKFTPVFRRNMEVPENITEAGDSEFCQILSSKEWVFSPHADKRDSLSHNNEFLPTWTKKIPTLWLILPLLTEKKLCGFILLKEPSTSTPLTWEDLDLIKTVGRQLASYLDRHEAAEMLAQSKQFDAFNKFTAFIMHDLKNLIAQQKLVVENAAKHKENPAFVEDAIQTIDNSVARMSNLLKKLQQQNEPAELRSLELQKVLIEAIKRCKDNQPRPTLRLLDNNLRTNADYDHLVMILTHMIKNAQEATSTEDFIDITLQKRDGNAIITIEDNGSGMSEDFIKTRLFKPFDTTKSGKGMGIGVFQAKEFVTSLGGSIDVSSTLNEGTAFTITLPISQL